MTQPKIVWKYEDEEDFTPKTDLCGSFMGHSVDVVSGVSGKWSVYVMNNVVARGIVTREEARAWVEGWLVSPDAMIDLIKRDVV